MHGMNTNEQPADDSGFTVIKLPNGNVVVTGNPPDATPEEIQEAMDEWLRERGPGRPAC